MKKPVVIIFIILLLAFLLPTAVSAEPVCTEEHLCNSVVQIKGQLAPIPFTGDAAWMSIAKDLFEIRVEYSDGIDSAADKDALLILTCSTDGRTFDTCEKENFNQVGSYLMRVTAAQSDKLYYLESYAETQLTITEASAADPDGLTIVYHDTGADSGSAVEDEASYKLGDEVTILGNLGLDDTGNPNPLVKQDAQLTGWNSEVDGKGHSYAFGESIIITRDLNLYPIWESEAGDDVLAADPAIHLTPNATEVSVSLVEPAVVDSAAAQKVLDAPVEGEPQYGDSWFLVSNNPDLVIDPTAADPAVEPVSEPALEPASDPAIEPDREPTPAAELSIDPAEEIAASLALESSEEPSLPLIEEAADESEIMGTASEIHTKIIPETTAEDTPVEPGPAPDAVTAMKPSTELFCENPSNETDTCALDLAVEKNAALQSEGICNPSLGPCLPATGIAVTNVLSAQPESFEYLPLGMQLELPLLDVVADLVTVPLEENNWQVRWLGNRAGMLEGSALPGEGITYIAAHNHLSENQVGPFLFISALNTNDRIFIRNASGNLLEYIVADNELYKPDDFQLVQQKATEIGNALVLITCENESMDGGYLNRRVVFAKPV